MGFLNQFDCIGSDLQELTAASRGETLLKFQGAYLRLRGGKIPSPAFFPANSLPSPFGKRWELPSVGHLNPFPMLMEIRIFPDPSPQSL